MRKSIINLIGLFTVLGIFILSGCAGGNYGTLKRVEKPAEDELRQDWKEYTVYYQRKLALVFKNKDDREITLNNSWVEVSSGDMMAKSNIKGSTWVKQIIGKNDQMFGYLVHLSTDRTSVQIIDENTVQLNYFYVPTEGGGGR
ncbi:MAG: hypothetical protein ACQ9MH_18235 [Nitrospinales bacterium]